MASPAPRMRSKDEVVREYRRAGMLEATRAVIGEVGIAELSMERIAQRAGVAKGTLYLYFKSKEDLVECALEYAIQEMTQLSLKAAKSGSTAEQSICAVASAIVDLNIQHRDFALALQDRPDLRPEGDSGAAERLRQSLEPFVAGVTGLFERGIASRELRPIGAARAARLFLSLIRGLIVEQLREPDPPDARQELEVLLDVFLRGIRGAS